MTQNEDNGAINKIDYGVFKRESQKTKLQFELTAAVRSANAQKTMIALKNGARAEIQDKTGELALCVAARGQLGGHLECLKILIESGVSVNMKDAVGWTPLMAAARSGQTASVTKLLEAGAEVDMRGWSEMTPLLAAAREKRLGCFNLLIDSGASVNVFDQSGRSLLDYCVSEVWMEFLDKILKADIDGIDLDFVNKDGQTALMSAARMGRCEKALFKLVEAGADWRLRDKDGFNALDFALKAGVSKSTDILLAAIARKECEQLGESIKAVALKSRLRP